MRVDLFLKKTRLIKRRSQAKIALEKSIVFKDNKPLKPASDVKNNDILVLKFYNKTLTIKVIILSDKEQDFQIISEEKNE